MNQPQQASSTHQPTHHPTDTPSLGQRIIVIAAILDVIFSFSTPRAIINLSKTCRATRPIAASYFRTAYKPERLLQRFLPDPAIMRAFRTLQAETGLTIFGKAAYNFLARASPTSIDTTATMSLYVDDPYASAVNDFFTDAGYDVEKREHEFVFLKTGEDDQIINKIVLHVGQPDSFDFVDKPQILLIEFTDVITFDGAYSLFPAQYDDELGGESASPAAKKKPQHPLLAESKPMYRSFSDRSSWVVTFDQQTPVVSPPQPAFGTSLSARDPLYTSSLLVAPPKGHLVKPCIQLQGVMLRSRLLRLTHILGCVQLSHFVQQFLTRLVIAHPGRSNSQFDSEVAQFLRACLELVDIRNELPSNSAVWAVMKEMVPLPSDTPGAGGLQWPCRT